MSAGYIAMVSIIFCILMSILNGCGGSPIQPPNIDIETSASRKNQQINLPPAADSQNIILNDAMHQMIKLTANDPENDPLTFVIEKQPEFGTLKKIENGIYDYHANEGFLGSDRFVFAASDGIQISQSATVSIVVNTNNPLPNVRQCRLVSGMGGKQSSKNTNVIDSITKLVQQDQKYVQKPLIRQTEERFIHDDKRAIVYDTETCLVWQDDHHIISLDWKTALEYCHDLKQAGYTDWRLPDFDELYSIYDPNSIEITDPDTQNTFKSHYHAFKISYPGEFWTSVADTKYEGWYTKVNFYEGGFYSLPDFLGEWVRCVRSGR